MVQCKILSLDTMSVTCHANKYLCEICCMQQKSRSAKVVTHSGPDVIKLFSCSTQLSMKFVLLINLKLLIVLNSFLLNIAEHENFSANKYENANFSWHFHIY